MDAPQVNGVSLKVYLEDVLTRMGYSAEVAQTHAVAMMKVMRSPALKETPFAILTPLSSDPVVFSGAVNSFRVRSTLGFCVVVDLVTVKREYEEHN